MEQASWEELLKKMQNRLRVINEIYQATAELEHALALNDKGSVQLWLENRAIAMEAADRGLEEMHRLLAGYVDPAQGEQMKGLIQGKEADAGIMEAPEAGRLLEMGKTIRRILADTIQKDRQMNTRLAGDKSFYQ